MKTISTIVSWIRNIKNFFLGLIVGFKKRRRIQHRAVIYEQVFQLRKKYLETGLKYALGKIEEEEYVSTSKAQIKILLKREQDLVKLKRYVG